MGAEWACERCGEPIGVYEPAIVVEADVPRGTSRINEPAEPDGDLYHAECWLDDTEPRPSAG